MSQLYFCCLFSNKYFSDFLSLAFYWTLFFKCCGSWEEEVTCLISFWQLLAWQESKWAYRSQNSNVCRFLQFAMYVEERISLFYERYVVVKHMMIGKTKCLTNTFFLYILKMYSLKKKNEPDYTHFILTIPKFLKKNKKKGKLGNLNLNWLTLQ